MRGQALPRAALKEALLNFSKGEKVVSRSKGGLRIFKNIMPVIMHKEKKRKNYNKIMTKRVV